jgi:hypothetical protein
MTNTYLTARLNSPSPAVQVETLQALSAIIAYTVYEHTPAEKIDELLRKPHQWSFHYVTSEAVPGLADMMQRSTSEYWRMMSALAIGNVGNALLLGTVARQARVDESALVRRACDFAICDLLDVIASAGENEYTDPDQEESEL